MYQLKKEEFKSLEDFCKGLPESLVRTKVERLIEEIEPTQQLKSEQLASLVSLAGEMPQEFQSFPQNFQMSLKNTTTSEVKVVEGFSAPEIIKEEEVVVEKKETKPKKKK